MKRDKLKLLYDLKLEKERLSKERDAGQLPVFTESSPPDTDEVRESTPLKSNETNTETLLSDIQKLFLLLI